MNMNILFNAHHIYLCKKSEFRKINSLVLSFGKTLKNYVFKRFGNLHFRVKLLSLLSVYCFLYNCLFYFPDVNASREHVILIKMGFVDSHLKQLTRSPDLLLILKGLKQENKF